MTATVLVAAVISSLFRLWNGMERMNLIAEII